MYACVRGDDIIAVHDDLEKIEIFMKDQESDDYEIVKLKRRTLKQSVIDEKWLTPYVYTYVPLCVYKRLMERTEDWLFDIKYSRDVLMRTLEFMRNKKDAKHVEKTVEILEKMLSDNLSYDEIEKLLKD